MHGVMSLENKHNSSNGSSFVSLLVAETKIMSVVDWEFLSILADIGLREQRAHSKLQPLITYSTTSIYFSATIRVRHTVQSVRVS